MNNKFFLFVVATMIVSSAKAQLEVVEDGSLYIGSNTTTTAQVNIKARKTNLLAVRIGTSVGIGPALEGSSYLTSPQWAMGVRGASLGSNGAINCGVWGAASSTTSNKIYGVFGAINADKGAAIYGQAYPWTSSSGAALTSPYAGYFDGNVHVLGGLTYTGVQLTSLPNSSSVNPEVLFSDSKASSLTSKQLQQLEVQRYIYTTPLRSLNKEFFTDEDFAGMDSLECATLKKDLLELKDNDKITQQIHAKQHYTLKAEQLEEVFPDLVYDNEDGTKSINYVEMVPILVQAINELSAKVAELEGGNGSARKVASKSTGITSADESVQVLSLGQNKPNPFGTSTEIEVSVPESMQSAFVYVYDLQGKKVQQVNLTARGRQTVQLNATSLADGMYLYSLIADGKVVETRRMIVEK